MKTFYDAISDFVFVSDELKPADMIFIPGSNFPGTVRQAARLYHQGLAPYILPSGRYAKMTGGFAAPDPEVDSNWQDRCRKYGSHDTDACYESEWQYMRDILLEEGVPAEAILKEDQATFTRENAIFSKEVLSSRGMQVHTVILCCKSFHARRALTYYQQQFPQVDFLVSPVTTEGITKDNWFLDEQKTATVLGELERMGKQFHCMLPVGTSRVLEAAECIPKKI